MQGGWTDFMSAQYGPIRYVWEKRRCSLYEVSLWVLLAQYNAVDEQPYFGSGSGTVPHEPRKTAQPSVKAEENSIVTVSVVL